MCAGAAMNEKSHSRLDPPARTRPLTRSPAHLTPSLGPISLFISRSGGWEWFVHNELAQHLIFFRVGSGLFFFNVVWTIYTFYFFLISSFSLNQKKWYA